jgi:N-methylhydantoinase B
MRVTNAQGETRELGVNRFYDISKGDVFELISQGGGGFGNPFERDPEEVLSDVVNGLVSIEKALEDYGVALKTRNENIVIDLDETVKQRSRKNSAAKTSKRRRGGSE